MQFLYHVTQVLGSKVGSEQYSKALEFLFELSRVMGVSNLPGLRDYTLLFSVEEGSGKLLDNNTDLASCIIFRAKNASTTIVGGYLQNALVVNKSTKVHVLMDGDGNVFLADLPSDMLSLVAELATALDLS